MPVVVLIMIGLGLFVWRGHHLDLASSFEAFLSWRFQPVLFRLKASCRALPLLLLLHPFAVAYVLTDLSGELNHFSSFSDPVLPFVVRP